MEAIKKFWSELTPQARTFVTGGLIGGSAVVVLFILWSLF